MARRTKPGTKCKGKLYWKAVAIAQEDKPKRSKKSLERSKKSLVDQCARSCRGITREECEKTITAGLKGRRSSLKSGKPRKRKLSRTKAAKAVRAGFKAAVPKCKRRKTGTFQSCMKKEAKKQIAKRM